jgi:hypothetical protein
LFDTDITKSPRILDEAKKQPKNQLIISVDLKLIIKQPILVPPNISLLEVRDILIRHKSDL